jgi:hypothetical protein
MSAILAGCVGADFAAEPDLKGPTFVVEVSNNSTNQVSVGYEVTAAGMSTGAEMLAPACRIETMASTASGEYQVLVAGKSVAEGAVPGGIGDDRSVVIRLRIDPDGEVEAAPPLVMATQPNVSAAIPGCR